MWLYLIWHNECQLDCDKYATYPYLSWSSYSSVVLIKHFMSEHGLMLKLKIGQILTLSKSDQSDSWAYSDPKFDEFISTFHWEIGWVQKPSLFSYQT